jgi:hypothetical protein
MADARMPNSWRSPVAVPKQESLPGANGRLAT